jgi:hypothetical protein
MGESTSARPHLSRSFFELVRRADQDLCCPNYAVQWPALAACLTAAHAAEAAATSPRLQLQKLDSNFENECASSPGVYGVPRDDVRRST